MAFVPAGKLPSSVVAGVRSAKGANDGQTPFS